ncbi:MAG: leucine--tRNA ligase [Nanoarchaeota archaeon]|nr:leucine--tRNA ligase [Nanoarchaeota archaeon]
MDFKELEKKWQAAWDKAKLFEANPKEGVRKFFCTAPYPYLNGPLHLGHAFTYTRLDAYARYWRMNNRNVLFPFAFHATGEPIVGAAKRIAAKDPKQIKVLKDSGVGEREIKKFTDPEKIVAFYAALNKDLAFQLGLSIDWRRRFTTIDPHYKQFITWQYLRLKEQGYVAQGTHPVIWCPACKSPTGDHDRLEGEGVSPVAFTLLKFKFEDAFLVAATLRPETIYGVTNIWLRPDSTLVKATVGSETWIISKSAAAKLQEQQKIVTVGDTINTPELIGKHVQNLATNEDIPILAADFVDPDNATGVVMSVPAHAPFDLMALRDLENAGTIKKGSLVPVQVVAVPGLGANPAATVCEKYKVKTQHDANLVSATKELYKKEFHIGTLTDKTGKYAGKKITDVKDELVADLMKAGIADTMYEPEAKVVCRSNDVCIVKILENQWFLTYSNPEWKKQVQKNLDRLTLHPDEIRPAFIYTLNWLQDKACARKSGLGTRVPWDSEWIIETLSDSTIYMAYYTIAHIIKKEKIAPENLTPEVFDYVFLGTNKKKIKTVPEAVLDTMRKEFLTWYPVDIRLSADELVYNHLTFFLFHHTALFQPEHWPLGIGVNGMVSVEGEKMSKSKGNFITVIDALETYGADVTRLALLSSAEGLAQPNWNATETRSLKTWLSRLLTWCQQNYKPHPGRKIDEFLFSRMQGYVERAQQAYETGRFRTALQAAFFSPVNDIRWYLRRTDTVGEALPYALDLVVRMIAPAVPHVAEECWNRLGNTGFVSTAVFPTLQSDLISEVAEAAEALIQQTAQDITEVQKIVGKKPKKIVIYVADFWKYDVYATMVKGASKGSIADLMKNPEIKKHGNDVIKFVERLKKTKLTQLLNHDEELAALKDATPFFRKEFDAEVEVRSARDVDDPKAKRAEPGKPGIVFT